MPSEPLNASVSVRDVKTRDGYVTFSVAWSSPHDTTAPLDVSRGWRLKGALVKPPYSLTSRGRYLAVHEPSTAFSNLLRRLVSEALERP